MYPFLPSGESHHENPLSYEPPDPEPMDLSYDPAQLPSQEPFQSLTDSSSLYDQAPALPELPELVSYLHPPSANVFEDSSAALKSPFELFQTQSPVPDDFEEMEANFQPFPLPYDSFLGAVPDNSAMQDASLFEEEVDVDIINELLKTKGQKPFYSGADLTVHEALVAILTHALTYSLSGQCILSLLKLISVLCPKDIMLKPSLYLYKKYFSHVRSEIDYQYFCSKCLGPCPEKSCPGCPPGTTLCTLIAMPLTKSLNDLFRRQEFVEKIQHCNSRSSAEGCSDIFDGQIYKEIKKNKEEDINVETLTAQWYTDGGQMLGMSAWPLMLAVNELPFKERYKKENMLIPAIWCGPVKPHGNFLLNAVVPELVKLQKGVEMEVFGGEKKR